MKYLHRILTAALAAATVIIIGVTVGTAGCNTHPVRAEVLLNTLTDDQKQQLIDRGLPTDYQGQPMQITTFRGIFQSPDEGGVESDSTTLTSKYENFANEVLSGAAYKNGAIWSTQPIINFDKNWQASMYMPGLFTSVLGT